jgi:RNA polymerase sigma-70 factor (ECF subfamily)
MPIPQSQDVTLLLVAWSRGEKEAEEKLIALVYQELRRLARCQMRLENPGNTLQTTALVNEAYLRLVDARRVNWQDRAHFFALSARVMRHIVVDLARAKGYKKRGGEFFKISLDEAMIGCKQKDPDIVRLDETLKALAEVDPRKSKVIELRFFGGLSVEETAEVLKVSPDTVLRDWRLAKAWLLRELQTDSKKAVRGTTRFLRTK